MKCYTTITTASKNWAILARFWASLALDHLDHVDVDMKEIYIQQLQTANFEVLEPLAKNIITLGKQSESPISLDIIAKNNDKNEPFYLFVVNFSGFDRMDAFIVIAKFAFDQIILSWKFPESFDHGQFDHLKHAFELLTHSLDTTNSRIVGVKTEVVFTPISGD